MGISENWEMHGATEFNPPSNPPKSNSSYVLGVNNNCRNYLTEFTDEGIKKLSKEITPKIREKFISEFKSNHKRVNYFNEREDDFFAKELPWALNPLPISYKRGLIEKAWDLTYIHTSKIQFVLNIVVSGYSLTATFINPNNAAATIPLFIGSTSILIYKLFKKERADKNELNNDLIERGVNCK